MAGHKHRTVLVNLILMLLVFLLIGLTIALTFREVHVTASETTMFISPSSSVVDVGQTFEVDINISEAIDLYGWEFKLGWNPVLLDVVNVTESSFLSSGGDTYPVYKVNNNEGYMLVGCTLLRNITGVDGSGTIARVEFIAEGAGTTNLDLYDTKLVSSSKQLTDHSSSDGTVAVSIIPVGGVYTPVDKLSLLAPYIALATVVLTLAVSFFYIRYRHERKNRCEKK